MIGGMADVTECLVKMLSSDNSAFQFSALGVLKNLSVSASNKARLLEESVVAGLFQALNSPQEPLQYVTTSLPFVPMAPKSCDLRRVLHPSTFTCWVQYTCRIQTNLLPPPLP